jgi:hypothetical protein
MPFDRQAGRHEFDLISKKCNKCGMTREHYEEHGKRPCQGRPAAAPRQDDKPDFIPDDPLENDL